MKWEKLLSDKRLDAPCPRNENGRTQFEKDIDRIIFSRSFRRLGRKTQVHLLSKNDHIHTRLSHSLEVGSVGRSLGVMVGQYLLDEKENEIKGIKDKDKQYLPLNIGDIVQAACLVHDIGNPPFGHATEEAIKNWFQEQIKDKRFNRLEESERFDLERFDGNAMSFRIVSYKEYYEDKGGMRLTYATLGAMLKYPWTSHFAETDHKFSCFKTECVNLCKIGEELGLTKKVCDITKSIIKYARHPLAYLVEAADDICYRILDIEDAIQFKILRKEYLKDVFQDSINKQLTDEQKYMLKDNKISWSIKNGLLRGKMIGAMIEEVVERFIENYDCIMMGCFENKLFENENNNLCLKLKKKYEEDGLKDEIYRNDRNLPLELGAYSVLKTLLETSMDAACEIYEDKNSSYKTKIVKKIIDRDGKERMKGESLYKIIMLFLDYINCMTDDYATFINRQLLGLGN